MRVNAHSHRWRLFTADLSGVLARVLDDASQLEALLSRCLEGASGHRPHTWLRHRFDPQGVSLLGQGARVRVAMHTWPELGSATLDIWSDLPEAGDAIQLCASALGARVMPRHDPPGYGASATAGE